MWVGWIGLGCPIYVWSDLGWNNPYNKWVGFRMVCNTLYIGVNATQIRPTQVPASTQLGFVL